jgi:hypothetical protein
MSLHRVNHNGGAESWRRAHTGTTLSAESTPLLRWWAIVFTAIWMAVCLWEPALLFSLVIVGPLGVLGSALLSDLHVTDTKVLARTWLRRECFERESVVAIRAVGLRFQRTRLYVLHVQEADRYARVLFLARRVLTRWDIEKVTGCQVE